MNIYQAVFLILLWKITENIKNFHEGGNPNQLTRVAALSNKNESAFSISLIHSEQ